MLTGFSTSETTLVSIADLFQRQRAHAPVVAKRSARERIQVLRRLRDYLVEHQADFERALFADFRKHPAETTLGELITVKSELRYTMKNLRKWMRPQPVEVEWSHTGTSAWIVSEPKGNVLIIAPWNYPINLALKPLVQALAAGNTVILKPSELTPHTSAALRKLVEDVFPQEEVAVVEGDATVAQNLLELPFDHIFFTGSTTVGKKIMAAASQHLASVTLELGGKTPAVVDESADVSMAARRIAWGKCINAGQTCIAPDYVLVHERVRDQFIEEFKNAVNLMYDPDGQGLAASGDYCRIVNERHFERLNGYLSDALDQGATLAFGGETRAAERLIAPTLLTGVTPDMRLMQEEIFGPLLPVLTFREPEEVLREISSREKPLGLYLFGTNQARLRYWLEHTRAGGTVLNDVIVQYGYPGLPWGGANHSGIGKSGGHFGFREFSNERGVVQQHWGLYRMLYPPYTSRVRGLLNRVLKYL